MQLFCDFKVTFALLYNIGNITFVFLVYWLLITVLVHQYYILQLFKHSNKY